MSNQTPPFLKSSQSPRWKIQELTEAFDLPVTQVAAAQGTASGHASGGNVKSKVASPPSFRRQSGQHSPATLKLTAWTQVAAAQGTAGGSVRVGSVTPQVMPPPGWHGIATGSAEPATQNSSEVCSRPTGWKFGRKPDRDLDDTTAGGFGT